MKTDDTIQLALLVLRDYYILGEIEYALKTAGRRERKDDLVVIGALLVASDSSNGPVSS